YMRIMKIRFEDRLTWQVNMPGEYRTVLIPKLIVQPIAENAILHGIGNKVGPGSVNVIVDAEEVNGRKYLLIKVEDDGAGMDRDTQRKVMDNLTYENKVDSTKHGLALLNVNQRLRLAYNTYDSEVMKTGISIESELGKGTSVFIRVPLMEE
ncbi:sensor histidine kinase, partial [Pseudomonas sp. 2822-15]|uniref:sensor histidine kinase n=2 Tax=unclassified Pseudomonas TaxID=196821 RepID=UPI0021142A29